MTSLLFPGAGAVRKASQSCSAAITPKVSLPLTALLLAGIAHNTAGFPAISFYDALMNWAISMRSQEVYRARVFILLEKFVLGRQGGVLVGTQLVLPGSGRVPRHFPHPGFRAALREKRPPVSLGDELSDAGAPGAVLFSRPFLGQCVS